MVAPGGLDGRSATGFIGVCVAPSVIIIGYIEITHGKVARHLAEDHGQASDALFGEQMAEGLLIWRSFLEWSPQASGSFADDGDH